MIFSMEYSKSIAYSGAVILFVIVVVEWAQTDPPSASAILFNSSISCKQRLVNVEGALKELKRQNEDILHRIR